MEEQEFKKGDYIVLLHPCALTALWASIPINYCYKLRENFTKFHFYIEKDLDNSTSNGWGYIPRGPEDAIELGHLKVRAATLEEINEYNRLNQPFDVNTLIHNKVNYKAILNILTKLNIR
jgi:hypothetical protein